MGFYKAVKKISFVLSLKTTTTTKTTTNIKHFNKGGEVRVGISPVNGCYESLLPSFKYLRNVKFTKRLEASMKECSFLQNSVIIRSISFKCIFVWS